MRWVAAVATGLLALAGCSDGRPVGSVVALKKNTTLYLDKTIFERAVELESVGAIPDAVELDPSAKRWEILYMASRLRVLAHEIGGEKVVVVSPSELDPEGMGVKKGMIGWVTDGYLPAK